MISLCSAAVPILPKVTDTTDDVLRGRGFSAGTFLVRHGIADLLAETRRMNRQAKRWLSPCFFVQRDMPCPVNTGIIPAMSVPVLPRSFETTRWSLVQRATGEVDADARQAPAALCDSYWYPVYAYIRRSGHNAHDAEDLTQGFFARLLEKGTLAHADPAKGRLRTFLLTCVQNFLRNEHARAEPVAAATRHAVEVR